MEKLSLEFSIHMQAGVAALLQSLLIYVFLPIVIVTLTISMLFKRKNTPFNISVTLAVLVCMYFFITNGIHYMDKLYEKNLLYIEDKEIAFIKNRV